MEIRNELRYLLSVGLWERMAADGLLTKEELARAKRLSVERVPARNCLGIVLAIPAGVWYGFVAKKDGRRRMRNG